MEKNINTEKSSPIKKNNIIEVEKEGFDIKISLIFL